MYIGIDLGTSSVKLLLVDKNGKVIKSISEDYPISFPQRNWAEQDPEDWKNATLKGLREIVSGVENEINGISFSGQMHGMVILDEKNSVIRPAILWCDQRTENQCNSLNRIENIVEITGNKSLTGFTAPKLLWLKENESENFRKIAKIMLPKDYLAFILSGEFSTDVSDASGTQLLNVKERKWSKEILDYLNLQENQLPKLYESYEVIGVLTEEIKEYLNINKNIKVIAGGGDQAVGAVGVGVVKEGILSVALGTSGVVFASSDKYFVDSQARLHSFCHSNGYYHQMGVILSAAGALKWWIEDINNTTDYNTLLEVEAKNSKIDEELHFLPYLVGERTPHNNPNAKGSITGLNIQHKRGDITRCILEGITFALKDSFEIIKSMGIKVDKIRVSGGGAKSKLWQQMIADILNVQVEITNSTEGPGYGAAILSMVGDGIYKNVNIACEDLIKVTEIIKAKIENLEIYNKKYEKFKELYSKLN